MPRGKHKDGTEAGTPAVSLSGYQPSTEWSGLHRMGQELYDAFMKALAENDRTGESLRFPVIGMLEAQVGHIGRPGIDKVPSIELRFIRIEPVVPRDSIDGDPVADAKQLMHQLQKIRVGQYPEDLFESAGAEAPEPAVDPASPGNDTKTRKPGKLAAVPPPAAEFSAE